MIEYLCFVKLTLKIKLLPDTKQAKSLLNTIETFNKACNTISGVAWDKRLFNQFKLHRECYHPTKNEFNLSAQLVVRALGKVADSYKAGKKRKREFHSRGAIIYDSRILSYKGNVASVSTIDGRIKLPFVCHRPDWIPYIRGEADLIFKKGKYFLLQTVEIPDQEIKDMEDFLGVDFGVVDIVSLSTGENVSSKWVNEYRLKREKIRSSVQRKGTKGAKNLLKRLSGKERATATHINHTLSKRIVMLAKAQSKGIAIEDLTHIRKRTEKKVRKKQRGLRSKWSFGQLRLFLTYKSALNGVQLVVVSPRYTSQTCYVCKHIGSRKGKNFTCTNCGNVADADINAALNISQSGIAVINPEKSAMYCSLHSQV